jgi:acyl-coenzyme A synthetase/AMP-(fatty) acid ligase
MQKSLKNRHIFYRNLRLKHEDPIVFNYSNLSWLSGVISLIYIVLNNGLRVVSKQKFTPKHFGHMIRSYGATATISSVEFSAMMMKSEDFLAEDYASMKDFMVGGERISHSLREFLKSSMSPGVFGVAYGSTECGLLTHFDRSKDTTKVVDNIVGKLRENSVCRIIDINTSEPLGVKEVGEIIAQTEMMFTVKICIFLWVLCHSNFHFEPSGLFRKP